jgi:hypothetical protein
MEAAGPMMMRLERSLPGGEAILQVEKGKKTVLFVVFHFKTTRWRVLHSEEQGLIRIICLYSNFYARRQTEALLQHCSRNCSRPGDYRNRAAKVSASIERRYTQGRGNYCVLLDE